MTQKHQTANCDSRSAADGEERNIVSCFLSLYSDFSVRDGHVVTFGFSPTERLLHLYYCCISPRRVNCRERASPPFSAIRSEKVRSSENTSSVVQTVLLFTACSGFGCLVVCCPLVEQRQQAFFLFFCARVGALGCLRMFTRSEAGLFPAVVRWTNTEEAEKKEILSQVLKRRQTQEGRIVVKLATGWPVAAFCPVSFRQKVVFFGVWTPQSCPLQTEQEGFDPVRSLRISFIAL